MNDFDIPGRVDFSIRETQWLADLHGIESDLGDTDKLCAKSLALMAPAPDQEAQLANWVEQNWVAGELSFAAVVKYGRTFGSGVRASIPIEWLKSLPEPYQKCHRYFKDLRDKFVAHSVNAFEDNQVFACLSPQFAPTEVASITVDTGRYTTLSTTDLTNLRKLAGALKARVQLEISHETARVLKLARAIPLADMLARETDSRPIPSASDVGKPRKA